MATFFSEQDPAPSFTARPQDVALEQRISKLAEFACKNGPPFVNMIREKQAGNPEYSFLSAGPGADYFTWKLYCNLYNLEAGKDTVSCVYLDFVIHRLSVLIFAV